MECLVIDLLLLAGGLGLWKAYVRRRQETIAADEARRRDEQAAAARGADERRRREETARREAHATAAREADERRRRDETARREVRAAAAREADERRKREETAKRDKAVYFGENLYELGETALEFVIDHHPEESMRTAARRLLEAKLEQAGPPPRSPCQVPGRMHKGY